MKGRGRGKALGGREATTDRVESKKRDEGSREKMTEGRTEETSRGREMTERGSGETDEGRGGMAETKRGGRQAAVIQVQRKNWLNKINPEPLVSPSRTEETNLIDLLPLTKRQRVCYLPKKTPEQRREREAIAKELGIEPMGGENPCERCANFGILCLPQDLP